MINDEHFFINLLASSVSSLEKQKCSSSNIDWVDSVFATEFSAFFIYFPYQPFVRYMIFRYTLPFCWVLFHCVDFLLCESVLA